MLKEKDQIHELVLKVTELNFLIIELKEKLSRLEDIEQRIDKLEQFNDYIKGTVAAVAGIFSIIVAIGVETIKRIFL